MSGPHPIAVRVCAASREHTSGRGRHDAERYGPCSDHARIVGEVLATPYNHAHVGAYLIAAERSAALLADLQRLVTPGWRTNTGYEYDDTTTAYAAGRNDLIDTLREVLAEHDLDPRSVEAPAAHLPGEPATTQEP